MTVRVLLVDDHEVVRRGVAELLSAEPDLEVVAEAGSVAEAVEIAAIEPFDVGVLDVRLPDGDGIDLCRRLRELRPESRCLILTAFEDDQAMVDASAAGAHGYLLKQVRGTDLLRAVRTAASGVSLLHASEVERARGRLRDSGLPLVDELTPQERRVFDLIGEGHPNRTIADELGLAEKTVKNYITALLLKLGLERRTEVAALAVRYEERRRPGAEVAEGAS